MATRVTRNLFVIHSLAAPDRGASEASWWKLGHPSASPSWDYRGIALTAEQGGSAVAQGLRSLCYADALVPLPSALKDPECLVILAAAVQRGTPVVDPESLEEVGVAFDRFPATSATLLERVDGKPRIGDLAGEATRIIRGARQESYGTPRDSFGRIAKLWSALLPVERDLTPEEVGLAMIALKLSREKSRHSRDNLVDVIGYAELTGHLAGETAL